MTTWALVISGLLALYILVEHNRLQRYRVECANAWSHIQVQLERRRDLIPRLVQCLKQAIGHESTVLERIAEARSAAVTANGPAELLAAESELSSLLPSLLGVVEAVPSLGTREQVLRLQEQLAATESRIAYTRGYYNDIVSNHNTLCEQIPTSLVARLFRFGRLELFREPEQRKELLLADFQTISS